MSIVTEFTASASYSNAGDATGLRLARSFRFWRLARYTATEALAKARADLAAGKDRYPMAGAGLNATAGERGGRWCERPEAIGLRFVGFSDEIAPRLIDHNGWYLNSEMRDELARGAVYQFPARDGRPLYVEAIRTGSAGRNGWSDMGEDGGALLFLGSLHRGEAGGSEGDVESDARDAARGADSEADIYGESERDYHEAWGKGQDAATLIEEAGVEREAARELLSEMRGLRMEGKPALCAVLRSTVARHLAAAREAYADARKLWEEHGDSDAFPEGANAASYWDSRK